MKDFFNIFKASFERDLKIHFSYKLNIIGELFFSFVLVFMLFYIASVFENSKSDFLEKYNHNYFLFLLSGLMVFLFLTRVFSSIVYFVSSAQTLGYFESFFVSKTSPVIIILASSAFPILQGYLRLLFIFIFAIIFDPNSLTFLNLFQIFSILLLSIIPFVGIGLIVTSIVIIYKRATFVSSIFLLGCAAFSGVIFPIDVLPSYLQKLSIIFPSSFSLDLVRGVIIEEKYLIDMLKDFFGIIVLSFFYLILGIFAVQISIIKAKKNGTIGHY